MVRIVELEHSVRSTTDRVDQIVALQSKVRSLQKAVASLILRRQTYITDQSVKVYITKSDHTCEQHLAWCIAQIASVTDEIRMEMIQVESQLAHICEEGMGQSW
jgi:hypothetical protein